MERQDDPGFHDEVQSALVTVALAEHVTTTLLSLMVTLVSLLYCAISSSCCHECCCPSINELEQIRCRHWEINMSWQSHMKINNLQI